MDCRFRTTAKLLPSLAILASCGIPQGTANRPLHETGKPTQEKTLHFFADVSAEELFETVLGKKTSLFPETHAVTKRMQMWADAFDEAIRRRHPAGLEGVPPPRISIAVDESPNAFSTPVALCTPLKLTLPEADTDAEELDTLHVSLDSGGVLNDPFPKCVKRADAKAIAARYVAAINATAPEGCKASEDGRTLTLSRQCRGAKNTHWKGARKLTLRLQSNRIVIHSGLISTMAEEHVVAILAHELGHYYRSHGTTPATHYAFFYRKSATPSPGRPVPAPELRELGEKLLKFDLGTHSARIPEALVHPSLFFPSLMIMGKVDEICSQKGDCSAPCKEHDAFLKSRKSVLQQLVDEGFPKQVPSAESQSAYLSYETSFLRCAATVALGDGRSEERNALLSHQRKIWDDEAFGPFPEAADLEAQFAAMTASIRRADDDVLANFAKAREERLGYYTTEQEADELAAELLSLTSIPARTVADAQLELLRLTGLSGQEAASGDVPFETCKALREAGWRDENGKEVYVPIGTFTDSHHGLCYRVFNLDEEVRGHDYQSEGAAPRFDAASWKEIQAAARERPRRS